MKKILVLLLAVCLLSVSCQSTTQVGENALANRELSEEVLPIHKEYIFENNSSDTVVLFIHGILGSPNHFVDFIDVLNGRFSIFNLLLPGHGKSGNDFTNTSMQEWSEYVTSAVLKLQSQSKYKNIIIVTHSLGGLLAIENAITNPKKIRGLFMVGLPLHIKLNFAGVVVGYKMLFTEIKQSDAPMIAAQKAYSIDNDSLLVYFSWIPHFWELYKKGKQVRPLVKNIAIPAVCIQSGSDEFVSQRSNRYIEENPHISLHTLPQSRHFYYEKSDQEDMLALFLQFIDRLNY